MSQNYFTKAAKEFKLQSLCKMLLTLLEYKLIVDRASTFNLFSILSINPE